MGYLGPTLREGKPRAAALPVKATKQMIKPRNTSTKCPQRLPCPLLPQDTRRREDKTAGENTAPVAPWGCSKQTVPLHKESKPSRGVHPRSLPEILLGDISGDMRFVTSWRTCYWHPPCLSASPSSKRDRQLKKIPVGCRRGFPRAGLSPSTTRSLLPARPWPISRLVEWGTLGNVGLTPAPAPSPPPAVLLKLFWSKSPGGSRTHHAACPSSLVPITETHQLLPGGFPLQQPLQTG